MNPEHSDAVTGATDSGLSKNEPRRRTTKSRALKLWQSSTDWVFMATAREYEYEPLATDEIRVFLLERGEPKSRIQISIEHVRLDAGIAYAAVSYTWGDAKDIISIDVEGRRMNITRNLWLALDRIREKVTRDYYVLWADAICINQADKKEKSIQVRLMSQIFPNAVSVICWLGEDDGTVQLAFQTLRKWCGIDKDEGLRRQLACAYMSDDPQLKAENQALDSLFKRDWFQRAWILQEVCSIFEDGKDGPLLLCGAHIQLWEIFWRGCKHLLHTVDVLKAVGHSVRHILAMLQTYRATDDALRFSRLIPATANRRATDPRDMFFSLHGLASRAGLSYPAPDYTWSLPKAQIVYTRGIIKVDGVLDLLLCCSRSQETDEHRLPSWVIKPGRMAGDCLTLDDRKLSNFEEALSKAEVVTACLGPDHEIFRVYGLHLDAVSNVFALDKFVESYSASSSLQAKRSLLDDLATRIGLSSSQCPGSRTKAAQLANMLLCNYFFPDPGFGKTRQVSSEQESFYYTVYSPMATKTVGGQPGCSVDGLVAVSSAEDLFQYVWNHSDFQDLDCLYAKNDNARHEDSTPARELHLKLKELLTIELHKKVVQNIRGRALVLTKTGHYALAPRFCQRGDEIVGMLGARAPLVLRPGCASRHELIGAAYFHDLDAIDGAEEFAEQMRSMDQKKRLESTRLYCLD